MIDELKDLLNMRQKLRSLERVRIDEFTISRCFVGGSVWAPWSLEGLGWCPRPYSTKKDAPSHLAHPGLALARAHGMEHWYIDV